MDPLDTALAALTTAANSLGTDVPSAVTLITTLQAAQANGTATPADLTQLANTTAALAALDASIQAVISATPTPTPTPPQTQAKKP